MHTTLISSEVLAEHLADPSWLIADCRYNLTDETWGRSQYETAHVPRAVFVDVAHDLAGQRTGTNGRHPLPAVEDMAATFGRLGIADDTQVVAYDQESGAFASRLWWMLRYLGHDAVAVLDGGFAKWTREGRPVRSGVETRPPSGFTERLRKEMRVTVDETFAHLGDPSVVLIDARSPDRYAGKPGPLDSICGHAGYARAPRSAGRQQRCGGPGGSEADVDGCRAGSVDVRPAARITTRRHVVDVARTTDDVLVDHAARHAPDEHGSMGRLPRATRSRARVRRT